MTNGNTGTDSGQPSFFGHQSIEESEIEASAVRDVVLPILMENGFTDIMVLSPYAQQVRRLGAKATTVHKSQGSEASIVVLSTAVSKFRPGSFLDNPRIACVGWSRQKPYLVVVGHAATLRQSPTWRPFIEMCESLKAITKVSNKTALRAMLPRR